MELVLSQDQEIAYKTIAEWLANGGIVHPKQTNPKLLTLAGFAGTGKTTLVSLISKEFGSAIRFAFCALSGRAASILGGKLKQNGINCGEDSHYCGTIHRLIYKPIENEKGEVVYWAKNPDLLYDIIVLDEASMISEEIFNDLASYGIDILAVGDHGQLPPIEGKFSLMKDPILRLEQIHRQAEDNPIINLSIQIRKSGKIPNNIPNNNHISIIKKHEYLDFLRQTYSDKQNPIDLLDIITLCYTNNTRNRLNSTIRNIVFGSIPSKPISNDLIICLKNIRKPNSKKPPLYNGYRGFLESGVSEYIDHFWSAKVNFPNENIQTRLLNLCKHQFGYPKTFSSFEELNKFGMNVTHWSDVGLLFDYGYALTVHKCQGDQGRHVILFNERPGPVDDDTYKRWAYTAITRSSDKLTIIL